MVCVEHVFEDRYCRFKRTFWIKTDGTYYYNSTKEVTNEAKSLMEMIFGVTMAPIRG